MAGFLWEEGLPGGEVDTVGGILSRSDSGGRVPGAWVGLYHQLPSHHPLDLGACQLDTETAPQEL